MARFVNIHEAIIYVAYRIRTNDSPEKITIGAVVSCISGSFRTDKSSPKDTAIEAPARVRIILNASTATRLCWKRL
jgi:hypothetical protein